MARSIKPAANKRDLPDGVVAATNGRVPMGTSAYALTDDVRPKAFGSAVRKGNSKNGMAPDAGTATHRSGTMFGSGPRFGISVKMAGGPDQSMANQNQANGRIVRPAVRRTLPNFSDGRVS